MHKPLGWNLIVSTVLALGSTSACRPRADPEPVCAPAPAEPEPDPEPAWIAELVEERRASADTPPPPIAEPLAPEPMLAWFAYPDETLGDAQGLELPRGLGATHVVFGRWLNDRGGGFGVMVSITCDADECRGERVHIPSLGRIFVRELVDLAGTPGPLVGSAVSMPWRGYGSLGPETAMIWPALVLMHRAGEDESLTVISLAHTPLKVVASFEGSSRGDEAGWSRSFSLVEGASGRVLDIVGVETSYSRNSRCWTEPKTYRWRLVGGTYREQVVRVCL